MWTDNAGKRSGGRPRRHARRGRRPGFSDLPGEGQGISQLRPRKAARDVRAGVGSVAPHERPVPHRPAEAPARPRVEIPADEARGRKAEQATDSLPSDCRKRRRAGSSPAMPTISSPSGRDRSREDSAARTESQPPERERSAATRTSPKAGKTNPVSHGHCVSVQPLFNQKEANHAIRHSCCPVRPRGRRVRAADGQSIGGGTPLPSGERSTGKFQPCLPFSPQEGRSGGSESLPGRTTLPAPPWRTAACTRPDSAHAERE